MTLGYKIGFLGLLGIAVLILIYILKPNYQQRVISSTYVWKLSLKYKKRRIPINRLRNLLLLICQVLILMLCTSILTQPFIESEAQGEFPEKIAIIDASASMLAIQDNGIERFKNAVEMVRELGEATIKEGGRITIILAGKDAGYVGPSRMEFVEDLYISLDSLIEGETKCTYGEADIDGAIILSESILLENYAAEVILFTATDYIDIGKVKVEPVKSDSEWNAAILNCTAKWVDGYYNFEVEVASYCKTTHNLKVTLNINGVNGVERATERMEKQEDCILDEIVVFSFNQDEFQYGIFAFTDVQVSIDVDDNFSLDNQFSLYGGTKPTIKVQYASSLKNIFFTGMISTLQFQWASRWNIEFTAVNTDPMTGDPEPPKLMGYDFYIFEHLMPATLPTDGVVLLVDPKNMPATMKDTLKKEGLTLGEEIIADRLSFFAGEPHPIMNYVDPTQVIVSKYIEVTAYEGFTPLIFCGGSPVVLLKEELDKKIAVFSFDLNWADLSILLEFPVLLTNMFEHFIPSTLSKYVYGIDESVTLNARGPVLKVDGPWFEESINEFPATISVSVPGTYNVGQTSFDKFIFEQFYVRISTQQSNFSRIIDVLPKPYSPPAPDPIKLDLLIYLAAILVFVLFAEWWLQSRSNA